jgi:hypothetical protein
MAAGLGFKTFNTGDVLTASEVNGYLMQGILVFADATARDAAITSPEEGQFAYTKDNNSLWYYSGSAWVASGATGDIEGVTAGTGISGGGTSGTVTITNSMATAIDAKGDLVVGTGADTFDRLAVGTNGHTLVADSVEATGLKWAAPASASLTSANNTVTTSESTTSVTYTDLTTTQSITLTTGTKVMVVVSSFMTSGTLGYGAGASYAISGATSRSASDEWAAYFQETPRVGNGLSMSYVSYQTVNAGSNTFTLKFRSIFSGGVTATFANRQITVIDLGS